MAFSPATYMVSEGDSRDLIIVLTGISAVPIEILLSTTGITASGIH